MSKNSLINLLSLALIQGSNALFPLAVFPYLFSVFDNAEFSKIVISEAIIMYVLSICLYSFDVSGVKDIASKQKEQKREKAKEVYWTVLSLRLILFLFIALCILISTYIFFNSYFHILLIWLMFPLGMIFQANFYYQAMEVNIKLGLIVFISRVLACFLTYYLIKDPGSSLLSISIIAGSFLLSGLLSFGYQVYSLGFSQIHLLSYKDFFQELRMGFLIFLGNFSVSMFKGSNILILGVVSTPLAVGVYSIAEKIIKSIQALSRPLNELAFPKTVKRISHSKERNVSIIIWNSTKYQIFIILSILFVLYFGLNLAMFYDIIKDIDHNFIYLLSIMAPAVLFGTANFMYGTVGLNTLGLHSYYALSIMIVGGISLIISIFLSYFFSEIGAAISFSLAEATLFLVFFTKYKYLNKRHL
jgi:polysaccharide transporter, PST family